nr:MAG TPA: hypothetical protein [Caudoviricetes sp.]
MCCYIITHMWYEIGSILTDKSVFPVNWDFLFVFVIPYYF